MAQEQFTVTLCDSIEDKYRFGFNGMEKDNELKGIGNSLDFGARIYDSRLGRWLSLDPLAAKYPSLSPYNFVANSPLMFIDPDGKKIVNAAGIGTREYTAIQNALEIIKIIYPKEFEELDALTIDININFDAKLAAPQVTAEKIGPYTSGLTKADYSLPKRGLKVEKNETTFYTIKRRMTAEERAMHDNPPDDNFMVIEKDDVFLKEIKVSEINITLNLYNLPKKYNSQNEKYKQLTSTLGHELIGHSYFEAIISPIEGFIWNQLQEENTDTGHEDGNPSGKPANDIGEKIKQEFKQTVNSIQKNNENG